MLQLGSSINYLHKGDSFKFYFTNEFGIKLYGDKEAHYHPSVFFHWNSTCFILNKILMTLTSFIL